MSATNKMPVFLTAEDSLSYVRRNICKDIDARILNALEAEGILPSFLKKESHFLLNDLKALAPLLRAIARGDVSEDSKDTLFDDDLPRRVGFVGGTSLPLGELNAKRGDSAIRPALRTLAQLAENCAKKNDDPVQSIPWLGGTFVRSSESEVIAVARLQASRCEKVVGVGATDFAQTAYYMGTKRELAPFLVEAIAGKLPPNGVVLDLMCGSGAASGAFSRCWTTFASDAQNFCQHLALVQGGGFDSERARSCLGFILEKARSHEASLRGPILDLVRREAELCHSDLSDNLSNKFKAYVRDVPLYPDRNVGKDWIPSDEVQMRQKNVERYPYCLFTSYFSTIYFGLRQSIEIDSIRYGIDQLADGIEREWALGALIVAVSVRATTYAAHFAQPPVSDLDNLSVKRIGILLNNWSSSIYHEFSVRFERLSKQSEGAPNPIVSVVGPWRTALDNVSPVISTRPAVIYLDAPYTREEYSRYYHVLETLVNYDYPLVAGRGRTRSKANGESFASEFFTRKRESVELILIDIIKNILNRKWICAWSYSNTGLADISRVIQEIHNAGNCEIECFTASHRHISQRGKPHKEVVENLVMFIPSFSSTQN